MSSAADALSAKLSRKRTKTGCLTCRKRRIKCGEERPICRNCVKSKRQCEGYAQRVVFKPPSFDFRQIDNGAAHITFHPGPVQGQPPPPYPHNLPLDAFDASHGSYLHVPIVQYQPGFPQPVHHYEPVERQHALPAQTIIPTPVQPLPPGYVNHPAQPPHIFAGGPPAAYQPYPNIALEITLPPATTAFVSPIEYTTHPPQPVTPALAQANGALNWQQQYVPNHNQNWQRPSPPTTITLGRGSPTSAHSSANAAWNSVPASEEPPVSWPSAAHALPNQQSHQPVQHTHSSVQQFNQQFHVDNGLPETRVNHEIPDVYQHAHQQFDDTANPTQFLAQAAVETQDDDYYDVEPDEEMETETSLLPSIDRQRQQTLHTILQMNNISIQDLHTRRYDTFIYDGILTHYRAEEVASPLRNPATARVFAHFISVTGPSLSIYERHPLNTSVLFTPGEIPFSQQGLWTYTMPMAALHHQGLLHAMLALASLHIARLQNEDSTPSMKHYAWSLKRIHNCVKDARKRYKLTTIAATMLLGFYEIMTADHMKWNTHLAGSKQLFLETDFVTMSQQFRRLKMERVLRGPSADDGYHLPAQIRERDEILHQIYDVDDRVVSEFAGKEVRYDHDPGRIVTQNSRVPPELDLGQFEILRDLYWWYLKQDAYQSIVSGNPLL